MLRTAVVLYLNASVPGSYGPSHSLIRWSDLTEQATAWLAEDNCCYQQTYYNSIAMVPSFNRLPVLLEATASLLLRCKRRDTNALCSHSAGARFKSRKERRICWQRILVVALSPSRQLPDGTPIRKGEFSCKCFQLFPHIFSCCSTLYVPDNGSVNPPPPKE
jgi:hypothetical protein